MTPFIMQTPKVSVRKYGKFVYPFLDIWYKGQRTRLHIGCKVLSTQWCKERQRAYISSMLSEVDNHNNKVANEQIDASVSRYMAFVDYLCRSNKLENFTVELITYMARPRKTEKPETLDIFKIIDDAVTNSSDISKGTQDNYKKGIRALKAFSDWRSTPIDSFENFDADLIDEFVEFLEDGNYLNKGKPYAMSSLNSIIRYAVSAIKCTPTKYLSKAQARTIPQPKLTDKTADNNEIGLRDAEVIKLWNYQPISKRDEEIRDMFLLLCLTGQRVDDLKNIGGGISEINGVLSLRQVQRKCSHKLANDIVFPLACEILKKYTTLPTVNLKKRINDNITRIARDAGINGTEQVSIHYQGSDKPTVTEVERVSLIRSHTGRRTFVSVLSVHDWKYQRIGKYTGQSPAIVERYDKSTSIDRRIYQESNPEERLMTYEEIKEAQTTPTAPTAQVHYKPNRFPTSVQEAKEVLQFLGVETISNDIGELLGFIMMREWEIRELFKGKVDILLIKDLFNTDLPLESRCRALKVFLDSQKGIS